MFSSAKAFPRLKWSRRLTGSKQRFDGIARTSAIFTWRRIRCALSDARGCRRCRRKANLAMSRQQDQHTEASYRIAKWIVITRRAAKPVSKELWQARDLYFRLVSCLQL